MKVSLKKTLYKEEKSVTTKIAIIDDHQLFREGVKRILEFEKTFEIVAEGDDGASALQLIEETKPDVVLMDINMPNKNGIEATRQLVETYPETRVIILSIHDDENYVTHALKTGATGYLLKEMDSDALIDAVKVVADGGSYLHPKITRNLVEEFRRLANRHNNGTGYQQTGSGSPTTSTYNHVNAKFSNYLQMEEATV